MHNLQTHLLECYVFIDDYLRSHPKIAEWRRSNNDDPDFTDAEVIVIALMQGYFRTDTLKRTFELVEANALGAFPDRPDLLAVATSSEFAASVGYPTKSDGWSVRPLSARFVRRASACM